MSAYCFFLSTYCFFDLLFIFASPFFYDDHHTWDLAEFEMRVQGQASQLFPLSCEVVTEPKASQQVGKPNGGWGDFRDHQLCLDVASGAQL